jgi:hypothetical protein
VSRAQRRSRRRGLLGAALLVGLLASLAAGVTALAFWTSSGSAGGEAVVGTLEPATIAAPAASDATVTITWDDQASMTPVAESPSITYTVERRLGGGGWVGVVAGPCSGALPYATVSCEDSVDVSGTYAYRVVADYASAWTAVSNVVTVVAVLDSEPPTTTVSFPVGGSTSNAIAYGSGCVPSGICGSAADATGVQLVRVSVQHQGGGYWSGSGFDGFSEVFVDATLLSPGSTSTSWSLPLPLPADGQYTVRVQARDTNGNDSAPAVTSTATFAIDTAGPTTTIVTTPAAPDGPNGWFRRTSVAFALDATDPPPGSGVAGISYTLDGGAPQPYLGAVTVSSQGDHTVTYTSVDNAGNPGPTGTARIALDAVAPATTFALSPVSPDGAGGWYRTAPTFTLTAVDATSGVAATRYRIDGGPAAVYAAGGVTLTDGLHTVSYWSEDVAGNVEAMKVTATIKVDTVAPTTTLATSPASPNGSNGWFRLPSVSFTLTGSDATSGVATRLYTIDGGPTLTAAGTVTISSPGDHVVTYWSVDNAGNAGAVQTAQVKVDAVAPTTTLTTSPSAPDGTNDWFRRSSVVFTLAATDATSGVSSTTYTVDGGAAQSYTGPVTIGTQGDHTITFWSTDAAGNVEVVRTARLKLDGVAPTTTLETAPTSPTGTNGWFTSSVSFTLNASDATSGVATRHYRLDGGSTQTFTGPVAVGQGDHTIEHWSVDNAGNVGATVTTRLKLDTAAPVTTLTTTPGSPDGSNGWFRQSSVGFTLTATDATSGVAVRRYAIDGGAPQTYTGQVTIGAQGDHTVTYWSTDNAGNVESVKSTHIKLDNVAPAVAVSLTSAGNAVLNGTTLVYKRNAASAGRIFRLRAVVGDASSQPASASFPALATSGWTHAAEGPVTTPGAGTYDSSPFTWSSSASNPAGYTLSVADQAGNTASQALSFVSDVTGPTATVTLGPSPLGALLTGTTLYYRSNAAGSFTLIDTVTDPVAGPASALFPAIGTAGWTHDAETVTTGAGGSPTIAYTSSPYSWTSGAGAPSTAARTVTSADRVGNTVTTELAFVVDNTGPTGGALRVNGTDATTAGSSSTSDDGSFTITRTDYNADAGSGFASSVLTRRAAPLVGGACGAFDSPVVLGGSPAQSGLAEGCYRYTLTGTDNLGNTSSIGTTVKVDVAPVVTLGPVVDAGGYRERFTGTTTDVSGSITIRVYWGGTQVQAFTFSPTSSSWSFETEMWDLIVGLTYTARAQQTDAEGNTSAWSNTITFVAS